MTEHHDSAKRITQVDSEEKFNFNNKITHNLSDFLSIYQKISGTKKTVKL